MPAKVIQLRRQLDLNHSFTLDGGMINVIDRDDSYVGEATEEARVNIYCYQEPGWDFPVVTIAVQAPLEGCEEEPLVIHAGSSVEIGALMNLEDAVRVRELLDTAIEKCKQMR